MNCLSRTFGFVATDQHEVHACQWKWPKALYIVYRTLLAAYTCVWLVYSLVRHPGSKFYHDQNPLAFLSTWTYILLTVHLLVRLLNSIFSKQERKYQNVIYIKHVKGSQHKSVQKKKPAQGVSWNLKLSWFLNDVVCGAVPLVTIMFFVVLLPYVKHTSSQEALTSQPLLSVFDINFNIVNTAIVLLDNLVCAAPLRPGHVIYSILYGIVYFTFTYFYYQLDPANNTLYPGFLDWSQPRRSIAISSATLFVIIPLIQMVWEGLYVIRTWIYGKIHRNNEDDDIEAI